MEQAAERTRYALEIQGLSHTFPGPVQALRDVTLRVREGESVAVVGPNGSGKSTLLLHAVGLMPSASVRIRGLAATSRAHEPAIRRYAGVLFQDPDDQLFMPTVLEDVAFGPVNFGLEPDQARAKALATLRDLDLEHLASRAPHHLSGGEKKLVALAAVLACDPELLALDEPSAGLDPAAKRRLVRILSALRRQGKTLLVATHDLDMAYANFERTVVLAHGRILADGPTKRLLADPDLMERATLEVCLSARLDAQNG